jgi:polysaccharide export outer membrane protein
MPMPNGVNEKMRRSTRKFFVLIGLSLIVAAVGAGQEPKAKVVEPPKQSANPQADLPTADTPAAPVDPKSYRIGPEDIIAIRVWREPEMSGQFIVRPDGRITLPLAGEVNVSELTPEQVQNKVIELYSKFINKPEVGVSLARVGSKKYYLVGQLLRTGIFPLVVPTTILEAINSAGGFQEFANKKKVSILRGSKIIHFNYEEVIKGKKMEQNIFVENGDHIIAK